jgi:hypothetical protein
VVVVVVQQVAADDRGTNGEPSELESGVVGRLIRSCCGLQLGSDGDVLVVGVVGVVTMLRMAASNRSMRMRSSKFCCSTSVKRRSIFNNMPKLLVSVEVLPVRNRGDNGVLPLALSASGSIFSDSSYNWSAFNAVSCDRTHMSVDQSASERASEQAITSRSYRLIVQCRIQWLDDRQMRVIGGRSIIQVQ